MPDVFFSTTLHLILRQGLSLSLELDALLAWLATEPQGSHWLCRPRYRNTQPHLAFSMSSRNLHFGSSRSGCGHFTLAWDGLAFRSLPRGHLLCELLHEAVSVALQGVSWKTWGENRRSM